MAIRLFIVLLATLAVPAWPASDFEFVVIGDTRPRFESEHFGVFQSLIPKINAVKPAFVINLGDLIYGYGLLSKEKQWDKYQQVVKAIEAPYHQLPGNHDVFSKAARRIYERRFKQFYGSFDYADCHFVLLDNCEEARWGYVGPAELDWLKTDLKQTKARSVFVFLHFPVWEPERVAAKYYESWEQTLHPLFRQARVRAVFAGHFHSYGPTREFDGIRYFITGGGGAELRPDYKKSGGDYHFVKVKVTGDTYDVRVLAERGELTDVAADVMGGLLFADRHSSRITITQGTQGLRAGVKCSITLNNPYPAPLVGKAEWTLDTSAFAVEPRTISVNIPPAGRNAWTFTLKALKDTAPLQSLPRLEFAVGSGGRQHRFQRDLLILQELKTPYRVRPPVLDGQLEDWGDIPLSRLGESTKPGAEVRAAHDGENLYLAVTVPTVANATDEESGFHDDLQVGISGRLSEGDFGGDVIRLGFTRVGQTVEVRDRTPGRKQGTSVPGAKSACRTKGDLANFEIAVPYRLLKPAKTGDESRLILDLSFPVPEEAPGVREPTDPIPNSFSYQVRYGSDSLIPVHFVALVLERRK